MKRMRAFDAFLIFSHHNKDIARKITSELEEKYRLKVLFDIRDFIHGLSASKNIEIAVRCSHCAIIMLSRKFLESFLCQQELRQCLIEQKQDPSFKVVIILVEEKDEIEHMLPEKISQEMIDKRCLDLNDPQLLDKLFNKMMASKLDDNVANDISFNAIQTQDTFRHNACSR